jgi:hypothetical protein
MHLGNRRWQRCRTTTGSMANPVSNLNNASNKKYASLPTAFGGRRGRGSLGDRRGGGAQGGKDLLTTYALGLYALWKMKNYEILI